jgi:mRNA deadenylase 3'-5' endonuclease subunit Ccr4
MNKIKEINTDNLPIFITGDFNNADLSYSISYLKNEKIEFKENDIKLEESGMSLTHEVKDLTRPETNYTYKKKYCDHIFYCKNRYEIVDLYEFYKKNAHVLPNYDFGSDHLPLVAIFELIKE